MNMLGSSEMRSINFTPLLAKVVNYQCPYRNRGDKCNSAVRGSTE